MNALALFLLAAPIAATLPLMLALGAPPAAAAALAVGVGLGASSIGLLLSLLAGSGGLLVAFDATVVLAGLLAAARLRYPHVRKEPWRPVQVLGCALLALAAGTALVAFFANAFAKPHGEWDAWAIWNLRARFLARAGADWRNAFSADLAWSHPDYPLLLPGAVARLWTYLGATPTAVPVAVALLFAAATAVMLYGALRDLSGRSPAILSALALLGTPLFLEHATWQYADIPLGFFFLATLALLAEADRWPERGWLAFLAGVTAGLAAWTKNEGLLFAALVVAVRGASALVGSAAERAAFRRLALGMCPAAVVILLFESFIAPGGDRFNEPWTEVWARLSDPARYGQVAAALATEAARLARWVGAALVVYLVLVGPAAPESRRPSYFTAAVVLLTLAGYVLIYVVTADALAWQLRSSGPRLLLQLWPSVLFAIFVAAASPHERSMPPAAIGERARRQVNRRSAAASWRRSA